jgi:hypothetical protein
MTSFLTDGLVNQHWRNPPISDLATGVRLLIFFGDLHGKKLHALIDENVDENRCIQFASLTKQEEVTRSFFLFDYEVILTLTLTIAWDSVSDFSRRSDRSEKSIASLLTKRPNGST